MRRAMSVLVRPFRKMGRRCEAALLRRGRRKAARLVDVLGAKHGLDPDQVSALRAKLEEVADAKVIEYLERRAPVATLTTIGGTMLGAGISVAIGVIHPPALFAIGVALAVTVAGSLFLLYRKVGNALRGAAEAQLIAMGIEVKERSPLLRRLAAHAVERTVERYRAKYELSSSQTEVLRSAVQAFADSKVPEFWSGRLKVETAVLAATAVLSGAITVGAHLVPVAGMIPLAVSAACSELFNLFLLYKKVVYALDGMAEATIEELLSKEALARQPSRTWLRRLSERVAQRVLDHYVRAYGLDDDEREALAAALDKVRANKLKELWHRRPPVILLTPLVQSGVVAGSGVGAGVTVPLALIAVGIGAAFGVSRSIIMLYLKLIHAIDGVAVSKVLRMRPGAHVPPIDVLRLARHTIMSMVGGADAGDESEPSTPRVSEPREVAPIAWVRRSPFPRSSSAPTRVVPDSLASPAARRASSALTRSSLPPSFGSSD